MDGQNIKNLRGLLRPRLRRASAPLHVPVRHVRRLRDLLRVALAPLRLGRAIPELRIKRYRLGQRLHRVDAAPPPRFV